MSSDRANFAGLVAAIARTHALFAAQASKAINISLTLRNWLIGHHIAEYELQGADRADYGERLMEQAAQQLGAAGLRRIDARELRRFRQFYSTYPQIREAVTPEIKRAPSVAGNAPSGPAPRMLLEHLSFTHFAELPLRRFRSVCGNS